MRGVAGVVTGRSLCKTQKPRQIIADQGQFLTLPLAGLAARPFSLETLAIETRLLLALAARPLQELQPMLRLRYENGVRELRDKLVYRGGVVQVAHPLPNASVGDWIEIVVA